MKKKHNIFMKILFFLFGALILYFSLIPNPPQPDIDWKFLDKIEHLLAYFLLAFLGSLAYLPKSRKNLLLLGGGIILFGIMIEFIQPFTGRFFELGDILVNTSGALLGIAIHNYIHSCINNHKHGSL